MAIDGPWLIGLSRKWRIRSALQKRLLWRRKGSGQLCGNRRADSVGSRGDRRQDKADAIVKFMKFITSEESVKQLTLDGAVFLSPKLDMEDPDVRQPADSWENILH